MAVESTDQVWPVGRKVAEIRPMTKGELTNEGWEGKRVTVVVFDDGSKLYASRDSEGNGGGVLFGVNSRGESMMLMA
jgi:hypothetical protein